MSLANNEVLARAVQERRQRLPTCDDPGIARGEYTQRLPRRQVCLIAFL